MAPAAASQQPPADSSRPWSVFNPSTVSTSSFNLRSVSHFLICLIAQWSKPKVKVAHLPEGESSMYFHSEVCMFLTILCPDCFNCVLMKSSLTSVETMGGTWQGGRG